MIKADLTDIAFFEIYLRDRLNFSDSSIYIYIQCMRKFLETNPDLSDIDSYNQFLITFSIKKRNTHYYSILKRFIQWKISDKKLQDKILSDLIRPPIRYDTKTERKHLTEDKILEIINALEKEKHRIVAIIQNLTGVRAGDVLRLKTGNILPEEYDGKPILRLNIVGKGKKKTTVFLHDEIAQGLVWNYIMKNSGAHNHFFITSHQKNDGEYLEDIYKLIRLNYWYYWKDMKQALNANGINFNDFATHDFRRCFARRVWEKYKDIQVLQGLLHHKHADTTMRYLAQSGLKNIDYLREMQM